MSKTKETIVVTGANGHLGRSVIEWLLQHYEGHIIATSREPEMPRSSIKSLVLKIQQRMITMLRNKLSKQAV